MHEKGGSEMQVVCTALQKYVNVFVEMPKNSDIRKSNKKKRDHDSTNTDEKEQTRNAVNESDKKFLSNL